MKIRKRTEITISTERIVAVTSGEPASVQVVECPECGNAGRMLTADNAAKAAVVTPRIIYRLAESGQLHSVETAEGSLLICPISLQSIDAGSMDLISRQLQNRGSA